ncbi:MAG: hypothetical protein HRU09_07015 [Oligoflexales bacterium]|nr:hypothetical protein [Oligoflexales bacterium]
MEIGSEHKYWKDVKTVEDALLLVEAGVIIKWKEMRTLKRSLSEEDQGTVLRHFAKRLCERSNDRLACEIIVESLLIWIANAINEPLIAAFLDQLFEEENHDLACRALVEIALTSEVAENSHDEEIYSMAVALICELGIAIREYDNRYPKQFTNAKEVLDHMTTYLLSVSNNNNTCIRLSLLHYFGYICSHKPDKTSFNRIMNRFGHTVLDHLFSHLFNKKSEAISLQFLLENLPFTLEADSNCQRILHETFKYYMLKKPERFALFIQTFTDHLIQVENHDHSKKVMMQHIGALFKVVSEVNHKTLARELLIAIQKFESCQFKDELIEHILGDRTIRPMFRDLLSQLKDSGGSNQFAESVAQFRSPKRGRKPSFSRANNIGTMGQVTFLGGLEIAKAS